MKPLAGNGSDTVELAALIDNHLQQLRTDYELEYWVADSALYSEANRRLLAGHPRKWITRVPARLTLAKEMLQGGDKGTLLTPAYLCRTKVVDSVVILTVAGRSPGAHDPGTTRRAGAGGAVAAVASRIQSSSASWLGPPAHRADRARRAAERGDPPGSPRPDRPKRKSRQYRGNTRS